MSEHESDRPSQHRTKRSGSESGSPPTVRRIGPYRILDQLGEGGMGVVYLGEQEQPIRRRVAIKVIRLGMDSNHVVARFESERQALALMDHPNIARVHDAGSTEEGLPYFVMELVQGLPVTEYCDLHCLNMDERLSLFIEICEGVHHAHQKGIIHRDIKPSNILVTIQEDRPVPKIIDFGVAKAVGRQLTEKTLFTEEGRLIGTPAYMSPEQAELTALDVDTRTDIYSLGVLLYELLVGQKPFDMTGLSLFQIGHKIREQEPLSPSTRLDGLENQAAQVAKQRRTNASTLRRQLRGDLDWISMKALEKDRTRRYSSASELAADIQRHLEHQPVLASPPGIGYRARKFVQRHRLGVGAAAMVCLVLMIGIIGVTVGLVRAARAEEQARREAETARQVSDFLVGLFEVSDPDESRGSTITAREVLDEGAERIERELEGEPLVQARLMETIGSVYSNLGLFDSAQPLLERALQIREGLLGPEHSEIAENLSHLAKAQALGRGDYRQAEELLRRAVAIEDKRSPSGSPELVVYLNHLSNILRAKGDYDEARRLLLRALSIQEQGLGSLDKNTALTLGNLATVHLVEGDFDQAETLFTRALAIQESVLGPEHPGISFIVHNLAMVYENKGDYQEAELYYKRALLIDERALGSDHPDVGQTLSNLGSLYRGEGDYTQAEEVLERAVKIQERALEHNHPDLAFSVIELAEARLMLNNYEAAVAGFERVLRLLESQSAQSLELAAETKLRALYRLGELEHKYGHPEQAKQSWAEAVQLVESRLPKATDRESAIYASTLLRLGRIEEATPIVTRLFETGYLDPEFLDLCLEYDLEKEGQNE